MDTYVYLFSTDGNEHFKENTLTSFSNQFPLSLKQQRVRIALQSLSVQAILPRSYEPKIIHVCIKNVGSDYYSGDSLSVIHSIPLTNEQIRLVHVVDRKTYFKLNTSSLKSISVELLDENFEKIEVATGECTIVQLKISSLHNDMKLVRIVSTDSKNLFPMNITNDFRVKLNKSIRTPSEKYEIALDSICYYNDILYKPPTGCQVIIEKKKNNSFVNDIVGEIIDSTFIHAADFSSEDCMLKTLNKMKKGNIIFQFVGGYFTLVNNNEFGVKVHIPNSLGFVMGASDLQEVEKGEEIWHLDAKQEVTCYEQKPNFSLIFPQTMLMMCDIIKPIMTGSIQQKVIKAIPLVNAPRKTYVHYTAKHLDFFTIDPPKVEEMHIQFNLVSNKKVHFASNRAMYCTFQIRKKFSRRGK